MGKKKTKKVAKIVGGVLGALAGVGALAVALAPKDDSLESLHKDMQSKKGPRRPKYWVPDDRDSIFGGSRTDSDLFMYQVTSGEHPYDIIAR